MSGRVIVVGAGVVGVTTAYFLARRGCEVTVVDRREDVALETSFANAGEISPGYASPWASPDVPRKIPKWLLMEHAPLILKPTLDPAMLRWLLAMLRNCTRERYALNKGRMVRLAEYSRDCLITLRAETGVEYDGRTLGTLQLFRTRAQVDASAKDIEVLGRDGVPFKILDRAGCVAREPGLAAASDEFEGGLLLPNDETGDCYKFTIGLAALARDLGVAFRFGTNVRGISHDGRRATGVETDAGAMMSDAVVLAAGSFSPHLASPLGLRLPVYPVKGYSATVPISQEELSPRSTLLDESYKIAITRLGDRIRIGGMAEISGYSLGIADARRDTLMRSARSLFPEAGLWRQAEFWFGLRPMTPDGTPVIGATNVPNLYLNTGHGTLGWTMACGSATVLADIVVGQSPAIDITGLGLDRYHSPRAGPFETTKSTQAVTA